LPLTVRRGEDARLTALPWSREGALTVTVGPSDGKQLASVAHAFAAVAETGTLVLTSGPDNPTTLNFLPDNHIVVVDANHIAADFERVFVRLRARFGERQLPRVVNMITGPSRSADIEQTLILGAHGPRRLHVIVVGSKEAGT
jgi:L-lactate dehydrogenase complex protein LldG